MKRFSNLPTCMSTTEIWLGLIYLPTQLLVIPSILTTGNELLGTPLSLAMINFLYFLINFLFTIVLFRKFLLANLDLFLQHLLPSLFCALRGYLIYYGGNLLFGFLIALFAPDFINVNDMSIQIITQDNFRAMAVGTVLFVPIVEETLYRGVVFGSIFKKSPEAAYAISVIIFCFIHIAAYIGMYPADTLLLCFLQYIPAGIALAWTYQHSGNIFAPILIHTAVNAIGIFTMR